MKNVTKVIIWRNVTILPTSKKVLVIALATIVRLEYSQRKMGYGGVLIRKSVLGSISVSVV
jgi:hypothetical protein